MKLSVCMIARNEAKNLPRSLGSVAEVADELIVVDTGSTDATIQIASDHGAQVSVFPWCDDFAAARNAALDQATGDWIFWLDADESLLAKSAASLRAAIGRDRVMGCRVVRRDLASDTDPSSYTQMWQLRLFRNRADLRFRGRCHPDFHPPLHETAAAAGMTVIDAQVVIEHWGYLGDMREHKLKRALKLIELELRDRPDQLYYLVEQFRTQKQLGDTAAASRTLEMVMDQTAAHIDDPSPPTATMALVLETLLQLPAAVLRPPWTPARMRQVVRRWFPDAPPLLWLIAQQHFMAGRFAETEQDLRRLVEMGRTGRYDLTCSFEPGIIGSDAKMNLAVCLVRQAKLDDAESLLSELIRDDVCAAAARKNLEVLQSLRQQHGRIPDRRRSRMASSTRRSKT